MSLNNAAPLTIMRVLEFMRPQTVDALLDVHEEVREAAAVYSVLAFVEHLRTHLKVKRGLCWLPKDFAFDGSIVTAVRYTAKRGTEPQQLMQDGGQPLRRLLADATRGATLVRITVKGDMLSWCRWLLRLLRVDSSGDCCCSKATLLADEHGEGSGEPATTLQFVHGQYPDCPALHGSGSQGTLTDGQPAKGNTFAYAAAFAGHLDCLEYLRASASSNIETSTLDRSTALHAAAFNNHVDCVKFILQRCPRLSDRRNHLGMTPIDAAVVGGSIDAINFFKAVHSDGVVKATLSAASTLHAPEDALAYLLRAGEVQPVLRLLASTAALHGRVDVLRLMTSTGVDFADAAFSGIAEDTVRAGRHTELKDSRLSCLEYFHTVGVPLGLNTLSGTSCAHVACASRFVAALEFLHSVGVSLNEPNARGETPLMLAVKCHSLSCVVFLVDKAAVDVKQPLVSPRGSFWSLVHACLSMYRSEEAPAILTSLIARGVDVNDVNPINGNTSCFEAAQLGDHVALQILIDAGADPSVPDTEGRTPMHAALLQGHGDSVRVLLKAGVRLDVPDGKGRTALQLARHLRDASRYYFEAANEVLSAAVGGSPV